MKHFCIDLCRWVDCVNNFGSGNLSLKEIFNPAIELARNGFPVSGPITSNSWLKCSGPLLKEQNLHGKELLVKGITCLHTVCFKVIFLLGLCYF